MHRNAQRLLKPIHVVNPYAHRLTFLAGDRGDDGTLFLTVTGQAFSDNRMTQMVRNCVQAARLGNIGSCHLFRHAMATQMLENRADVWFIQAMLGHADIKTTQVYTRASIRALISRGARRGRNGGIG